MNETPKKKKPDYPLIWYGGRLFRPVKTEGASETTGDTVFKYEQNGDLVTAQYSGGDIAIGHLIATIQLDGSLDMRYHHRNKSGELMTGICKSVPEILPNGKLRLHETWQWTCRRSQPRHISLRRVLGFPEKEPCACFTKNTKIDYCYNQHS